MLERKAAATAGVEENAPPSMRRNISWILGGSVAYRACQWGVMVVLAKIGGATMVGQFALGLAVSTPIIIFTNLGLRTVQITDAKKEYLFGDYMALRLASLPLAMIAAAIVVLWGGYDWRLALVVLLVALAKCVESVSDILLGFQQQHERLDRVAWSMLLKGPLTLLAMAAGVWLSGSLLWGVLAMTAAYGLTLVFYDVPMAARLLRATGGGRPHPRPRFPTLAALAWLSLPLALVGFLISLNTNIPRYFITHFCGEAALGVFAAIAYLMLVGDHFLGAFTDVASPRLAKRFAVGDHAGFTALLTKLMVVSGVIGAAGILIALIAGRQVLTLVYRPEFADNAAVFVWLMVASTIAMIGKVFGNAVTAMRVFRAPLPVQVLSVLSTLVLCALFVPGHGLLGAAWAICANALFVTLAYGFLTVVSLRRPAEMGGAGGRPLAGNALAGDQPECD